MHHVRKQLGSKIIWIQEQSESNVGYEDVNVEVEFSKNGKTEQVPLKHFLENECDESMHESIRTNVFVQGVP